MVFYLIAIVYVLLALFTAFVGGKNGDNPFFVCVVALFWPGIGLMVLPALPLILAYKLGGKFS